LDSKYRKMVEEKIIKINLRKQLKNLPRWKRHAVFGRLLRKKLKIKDMKIAQNLNKSVKVRVKLVKDDNSVRAELA